MNKILFVDDEKNILEAYKRNLSDEFEIAVADSGAEALEIISNDKSFRVIVSDFKMPKMNGVELLGKVRQVAPDTVQIMLTGQAEMDAIINLINKGKIFRFLTKPCSPEDLVSNIKDAVRQYELVSAERELLGKTLGGSIKVLTDLLALAKPLTFNKTQKIRTLAKLIYNDLDMSSKWQIEIAATLSQIGCVTIPDEILKKVYKGLILSEEENKMFSSHPSIGADMIESIPRMDKVAEIIRYQEKRYDGSGFPSDNIKEDKIPAGSRILKIALDYDKAVTGGLESEKALAEMSRKPGRYDPFFLSIAEKKFFQIEKPKKFYVNKEVSVKNLEVGMILDEDLNTAAGAMLSTKKQVLTPALISAIRNYVKNGQLKDTIKVVITMK
ncbi:MAG TPA: response regulator [Spirochaetota bacterium]|nr:response regulator [Spirochaetota bacterium]